MFEQFEASLARHGLNEESVSEIMTEFRRRMDAHMDSISVSAENGRMELFIPAKYLRPSNRRGSDAFEKAGGGTLVASYPEGGYFSLPDEHNLSRELVRYRIDRTAIAHIVIQAAAKTVRDIRPLVDEFTLKEILGEADFGPDGPSVGLFTAEMTNKIAALFSDAYRSRNPDLSLGSGFITRT